MNPDGCELGAAPQSFRVMKRETEEDYANRERNRGKMRKNVF